MRKQGVNYSGAWHECIFLHFPTTKCKLPDVHLCNFEYVDYQWETALADVLLNITYLMSRRHYRRKSTDYCDTPPYVELMDCRLNPQGRHQRGPTFSKELLHCRDLLEELAYSGLLAGFQIDDLDIPPPADLNPTREIRRQNFDRLKDRVAMNAKKARANTKLVPDLRGLRNDETSKSMNPCYTTA